MLHLCDDYHAFTLQEVIEDYNIRLTEHTAVVDSSRAETEESKINRFRTYDEFELYDRGISRLSVEACVSVSLKEKVKVRFSHKKYFEVFPGQVYFMMVLDTCHTSASMDIDGANKSFAAMILKDYPGENVAALATAALK